MKVRYRRLKAEDDEAIARIIRENLEEAGLDIPGTAYFDPELDRLSAYYDADPARRAYFVVLSEAGEVLGGVGAAAFRPMDRCAELQKLYLRPDAKGQGLGRGLMEQVLTWAREAGFRQVYLETHSTLTAAVGLYEALGFRQIPRPACAFHGTMDLFYRKELSGEDGEK